MHWIDLLRLPLAALGQQKLRACLTTLGVIFGAAALLVATTTRRAAHTGGHPACLAAAAAVLGVLAIAADIVGIIIGVTH